MEKFRTHAGLKSFDDIVSEIVKKPKDPAREILEAKAVLPGDFPDPNATVKIGPDDFKPKVKVKDPVPSVLGEFYGSWKEEYAAQFMTTAPTGPVGPSGTYQAPAGANGPAGPVTNVVPTAPSSSPSFLERDRAEVDLRQAIRRCLKENVPLDRMVEIFRLELVDVVHDD